MNNESNFRGLRKSRGEISEFTIAQINFIDVRLLPRKRVKIRYSAIFEKRGALLLGIFYVAMKRLKNLFPRNSDASIIYRYT